MEATILKNEKNEMQVEMNNQTVAEILRIYLNKDDAVTFTAWRKEHPIKNPILTLKTSGKTAKKALADAIEAVEKDTEKLAAEFKKAVK